MTNIIFLNTFIIYKIRIRFINRVICQMHKHLIHIFLIGLLIFHRCESSKTLLINKQVKGITAGQKHIDPKIEFKAINQQRLLNILLHYKTVESDELFRILSEKYAFALALGVGFYYKRCIFISLKNMNNKLIKE